ncbi:MAG: hypothetical protein O7C75_06095 [Verrucomicrobia bacterium]|nr:hypothetical protein [Verrucomicrobiota bacterium]
MGTTKRTKREPWKPSRGIRLYHRADRETKPWVVQWRVPGESNPKSKSFEKEAYQILFAKDLDRRREDEGKQILNFDPKEWKRYLLFKERIGGAHNLDLVERMWLGNQPQWLGSYLEKVGRDFLREKDREGLSRDSYDRYVKLIDNLNRSFPRVRINELDDQVMLRWLDSLASSNGKPFTPVTKNNWRKLLNTFFSDCVRRRYITDNPIDLIAKWGVKEKPVGILSPEEGRQLFSANREKAAIGRLALEAFAGMRYSSARRLQKKHINFDECGIELPGARIKTQRRIYVDGFPENLWEWVNFAPKECWSMPERVYQEEKKLAFIRANVPHPHNCLRHSFATYHVAKFKNVGLTATLLCHTNIQTLNRFYRGNATHSEGVEWFEIMP